MTPAPPEIETILLRAAREAADVILRIYAETDMGVRMKRPDDPVTRADREANALLVDRLARALPGLPIVAEESPPEAFAAYRSAERALFVDPVDGTRELVAKNGEFSVMIGYVEDGRPKVGVVVRPTTGDAFVGALGVGAKVVRANGEAAAFTVGTLSELGQARCAVSRSHRGQTLEARLALLGCRELVPMGSAGLKAIAVARREVDLYAHPTDGAIHLWDACAPEAIVRAAGGVFTSARGEVFDYRGELAQSAGILAGNTALHAAALQALKAVPP